MPQPLPALLDAAGIAREMGVTRAYAEKIMRQIPKKVRNEGIRKVYVKRADVLKWVEENTVEDAA